MKKIKLTQGKYALVDDVDYEWLNQWKWFFNQYAARFEYLGGGRQSQKNKMIHMHRLINNTPDGFETDHINRDKLDNRRSNLRTVDRSLNSRNKPPSKKNTSGYKGIDFYKRIRKWRVRMSINKKNMSFGYYKDLGKAVEARQEAEAKYGYTN